MTLWGRIKKEANYTFKGIKHTLKGIKYVLRGMKYPLLGFILFNMGLEINYFARSRDSTIVVKDKGGAVVETIPVFGKFKEKRKLERLENLLNREYHAKPFNLSGIYINKTDDFWNKSFTDRITDLLFGSSCYYNPFTDTITLDTYAGETTWSHEVKHDKWWDLTNGWDIIFEYTGFNKEWIELAEDENGNSLYKGMLSMVDLFEDYYETHDKETLLNNGFVSNYARTWFVEDIAETCEDAIPYPKNLVKYLYEDPKQKLIKKIKLAEKYELIPPEFSDYAYLLKIYNGSLEDSHDAYIPSIKDGHVRFKTKKLNELMENVDWFISDNSDSIYIPSVLLIKGQIMDFNHQFESLEHRIKFYEKIFNHHAISWESKHEVLEYLDRLSFTIKDEKRIETYNLLLEEYKEE